MGIKKKNLFDKVIMNVGSGREALGLLQFNPKWFIIMIFPQLIYGF